MRPNLPKLRANAPLTGIGTPGHWHYERGEDTLARLAESLEVGPPPTWAILDKLPDVFARAVMMHMVLAGGDERHPLYQRVRGAFRGCLAVMALWQRKRWVLKAHPVPLSPAHPALFVKTAARLLPQKTKLSPDTLWQELHVLTLDEVPFAMTSPLTLICPNSGIELHTQLARVPWIENGEFVDPKASLGGTERRLLSGWLDRLHGSVARHPDRDEPMVQALGRELSAFVTDLGVPPLDVQASASVPELQRSRGMFQYLAAPLPEDVGVGPSMVELQPSNGRGDAAPRVLIIDGSLTRQWDIPSPDIRVYGPLTLADLEPQLAVLGTDPERLLGVALQGSVWRPSEYFFTSQLLLVDTPGGAFPGAVRVAGHDDVAGRHQATPILPLKSELLRYLSPADIASRCRWIADQDTVTLQISLPLPGRRECVVRRAYKPGEIIRVADVPVIELWPNFQSHLWHAYYLLWDRADSIRTFYAAPVNLDARRDVARESDRRGTTEREITELSRWPEAVVCAYPQENGEPAGLLLLDVPRHMPGGGEFVVGVDFGTTNTNVYFRRPDHEPEPLRLTVDCHRIAFSEDAKRQRRLTNFFLPPADAAGAEGDNRLVPFQSLFRSRSTAGPGEHDRAVIAGHILFPREDVDISLRTTDVHAYLKWQREAAARQRVKTYLWQVALHAAVEAFALGADSVRLAYSYPTAFSMKMRLDMESTWRSIGQILEQEMGIRCTQVAPPRGYSESVAAARYFHQQLQAEPYLGSVVMDIGGGTTDVAVWQQGRLLWQTSLRLAGRELLLAPLYAIHGGRGPDLVAELFGQRVLRDQQPEHFYREVDRLLKMHAGKLNGRLVTLGDTAPMPELARHVTVGLAGLFYYVGLMLKVLAEQGKFSPTTPKIYVGGNGSRLLDWPSRGHFDPLTSPLLPLFRTMVLRPSGLPADGFEIVRTRAPKAEAACGLVVAQSVEGGQGDGSDSVIAGEECVIDGVVRSVLTEADLGHKVSLKAGLSSLTAFVGAFNEYATGRDSIVKPVSGERDLLQRTTDNVKDTLLEHEHRRPDEMELEPVFIVGLRALLERMMGRGAA